MKLAKTSYKQDSLLKMHKMHAKMQMITIIQLFAYIYLKLFVHVLHMKSVNTVLLRIKQERTTLKAISHIKLINYLRELKLWYLNYLNCSYLNCDCKFNSVLKYPCFLLQVKLVTQLGGTDLICFLNN